MNKNLLYPLLSPFFSAGMLLCSEILTVKYNISPIFLMLLLNAIGGSILFLCVKNRIKKARQIAATHPFLLAGASVFSYLLSGLATFYAASQIGSTKISFALQLETVFVVAFAVLFLKEKLTKKTISAGLLIVCGGILLQMQNTGIIFTWTDIVVFLAPFLFSIGILLNTELLRHHDALAVTAFGQISVAVLLCIFLPWLNTSLTGIALLFILLMSVLEGFAWLFYNKGLATVGASVTTILFGIVPFFTLLFSFVFNRFFENYFIIPKNIWFVIAGGMCIFAGIVVISKSNP
jgi:drug/metabolite transporter (DMT)-like permease